jgi:hypothetical protein
MKRDVKEDSAERVRMNQQELPPELGSPLLTG